MIVIHCPQCHEEVSPNAKGCAKCGSSLSPPQKDWEQPEYLDGLDLPDDDFDYDAFLEEEFGEEDRVKPRHISWLWWWVAILLVVSMLGGVLMYAFF